jgi:hypothetical protein
MCFNRRARCPNRPFPGPWSEAERNPGSRAPTRRAAAHASSLGPAGFGAATQQLRCAGPRIACHCAPLRSSRPGNGLRRDGAKPDSAQVLQQTREMPPQPLSRSRGAKRNGTRDPAPLSRREATPAFFPSNQLNRAPRRGSIAALDPGSPSTALRSVAGVWGRAAEVSRQAGWRPRAGAPAGLSRAASGTEPRDPNSPGGGTGYSLDRQFGKTKLGGHANNALPM